MGNRQPMGARRIGGDIERVDLEPLQAFYAGQGTVKERMAAVREFDDFEPRGSNGFAIGPSKSASKHALLWINPHTSFFFRAEAQATSDEGLNAYGAITWGQFFVYQGFNERAGWMHTSSGVDNVDEYLEAIVRKEGRPYYRYGSEDRPFTAREVVIRYKTAAGFAERKFTVYRSHHGPIVRAQGDKWVSVRLMEEPVHALTQSYQRTKARGLKEFAAVMELHTNSSNNTVFADADGNIAYFHANFIPQRSTKFDWNKPVDGSDAATEWGAPLAVAESPNVINPKTGWLYNTNNPPWTAAGNESPRQDRFPPYVDTFVQNPRGVHALRVLSAAKSFTPETLIAAAFDPQLPEMELLVPKLLQAYTRLSSTNVARQRLAEPIKALQSWDRRWSADSVATTLAVLWAEELWNRVSDKASREGVTVYRWLEERLTAEEQVDAFQAVVDRLEKDFGSWRTPWGAVNRFQRISNAIVHPFDDSQPSIAVPFTSARWGWLASFGARRYQDSKKLYGTTGNSFLAVVEFGDRVRARAVTAGGQSGNPASPHFNDQAVRYAHGDLRDVYFYPEQLQGHTERTYHPGQ